MRQRLRNASAVERFWFSVVKVETGCWLWKGIPTTYGSLKADDGRTMRAHRFSYELHNGPVPVGLFVCHKCDVRGCVNPAHLYAGTHEDNNRDMNERSRRQGPNHKASWIARRALSFETVELVKQDYATNQYTMVELAQKYGCSQATISSAIRGVQNYGRKVVVAPEPGKRQRSGHFRSKLTESQRQEIREKYATGAFTQTQLAVEYGVTQTRVSDIITGRDYKRSITPETPQ